MPDQPLKSKQNHNFTAAILPSSDGHIKKKFQQQPKRHVGRARFMMFILGATNNCDPHCFYDPLRARRTTTRMSNAMPLIRITGPRKHEQDTSNNNYNNDKMRWLGCCGGLGWGPIVHFMYVFSWFDGERWRA